jgi:hypothetical protein
VDARVKEITDFASVLDTAIPAHDDEVIALAVDTVGGELRELTEHFPDRKDTSVPEGKAERNLGRVALKELVLSLRRLDLAASGGHFDEAAGEYARYRTLMADAVPLLKAAEPWSLFNPKIREAHDTAMRLMLETANKAPPEHDAGQSR